MRLEGVLGVAVAIVCSAPARAQTFAAVQEVERYQAEANQLTEQSREATQQNIDRAVRALQTGDHRAARKYAAVVSRSDPRRVEAWLLLGSAQMGLQDWRGARKSYGVAVRLWPGHAEARAGLGVSMAMLKDPRATVQLAWIDDQLRGCGECYRRPQLTDFRSDVHAAIRNAGAGS